MATIRPFQAIRPAKGYEDKIAALPYDVFSLSEARLEAAKEPLSFLAIDRPEIIVQNGENIYEAAGRRLKEQIGQGYYVKEDEPCLFIYQLSIAGRSQSGVVALSLVDDYLRGTIHRHENTRAEKEADRIAHVEGCMAQTGPIFLAYRAKSEISAAVAAFQKQEPLYDFETPDGVTHRIWRLTGQQCDRLEALFDGVKDFYIADGHHRCAAAAACALKMRKKNPDYRGDEPWNYIMSVIFPDEELLIMDYNRILKDLNGLTEKQLLARIGKCFEVEFSGDALAEPAKKGVIGMYLRSGWYTLYLKEEFYREDPVEGLDVALLQRLVLDPVFGIKDPRTDERILFVGGIRGTKELVDRVNRFGGAAFWMHPTSMKELFDVANAGLLMPPKSTWFEPKLRSGLFIHSLEE